MFLAGLEFEILVFLQFQNSKSQTQFATSESYDEFQDKSTILPAIFVFLK